MSMRSLPAPVLVAALLVSMWLGASAFFSAFVARAAFDVLPTRALAGALVGRLLPILFAWGIATAIVSILVEVNERAMRLRSTRFGAAVCIGLACTVAQFLVGPRIEKVRATIGPAVDALAPSDPRRIEFGRLHGVSVGLLGVALIAAFVYLITLYSAARARS